jgi:Flp pilus assembly protein TadG
MMLAILGMAALVIDVGAWYQARRQAQSAADAAALAGMQDLPNNPTAAVTDAQSYISQNISGATATVTTPYLGSSTSIKVTISENVQSIFGGALGITSVTVTASAAAKKDSTAIPSAIFAYDSNCSDQALTISSPGNNINVIGATHSNGTFAQQSNNGRFGPTTFGGPNRCSATLTGNNDSYSSGPTQDPSLYPYPYDYSKVSLPCTYSGASFSWGSSGTTIPSGVYCATGQISLSGSNMSCSSCTFIADSLVLTGNNESFPPYAGTGNLSFYETGTTTLALSGNSFLTGGTVFAPNASVVMSGNTGSASGFIEALRVTISGNNFSFTGTGPVLSGTSGSLIQ